jgi:DtxR family Mn-dependent transcriptional regulator
VSAAASVTPNESKYLTFLYRRQVEEGETLRTSVLARTFKVQSATVTEVLQKLATKGLIEYTPYYGAQLTEDGLAEAQRLLRKHRLLEVLFVELLNYESAKACDEASKLDYYCSDDLINTICQTYSHPTLCPCNKVIMRDQDCLNDLK